MQYDYVLICALCFDLLGFLIFSHALSDVPSVYQYYFPSNQKFETIYDFVFFLALLWSSLAQPACCTTCFLALQLLFLKF